MNKLTPILIAGSLAISAGLAFAQKQMNKDNPMQGHTMSGHYGNVLKISAPLIITQENADLLVEKMQETLTA